MGVNFLKKRCCCVGGGYNKIIRSYRLSWKCNLATVKSFKADVSSVSPSPSLWLRANAQNVSFEDLYGGKFIIINSVDRTKITLIV